MRDGNSLAGSVVGLDETSVRFERDGRGWVMPVERVARLIFGPVPPENAAPSDHQGILLANGDFVEGDAIRIGLLPVEWPRPPQLKASVRSVLFGQRSFEIAREVICVDLNATAPAPAAYEVRLADGSLQRARNVSLHKGAFEVDGRVMGDVAEVRRIGAAGL